MEYIQYKLLEKIGEQVARKFTKDVALPYIVGNINSIYKSIESIKENSAENGKTFKKEVDSDILGFKLISIAPPKGYGLNSCGSSGISPIITLLLIPEPFTLVLCVYAI